MTAYESTKFRQEGPIENLGQFGLTENIMEKQGIDVQIGERVTNLLKERGLKKRPFALSVGLDDGQFRHLIAGRIRWNTSHLSKVAEGLGISPADLLEDRPRQIVYQSPPSLQIQKVDRFKRFDETFAPESYIPIRLLEGAAAAGSPTEVLDYELENAQWVLIYASREWMPNDPEDYTCIKVSGESMWPILSNGDIVAVDHAVKDPVALDGKMAVFKINGGVTIKWLKFMREQGVVVGVPENRDELDHVVTLSGDQINTGIVGKVAWWWSKR
jgi:phage repressor protein C with HTH and peptisase S24 domain